MSIKRDDIDNRKVDFSNIASGRRLAPVHPGEILRDEFLTPMKISVYELAKAIKVPRTRANDIVLGRRAITIDSALRLGRYFGTSSEFWINLQTRYDLRFSRPHRAASDRAGNLAPRGLTETADVLPWSMIVSTVLTVLRVCEALIRMIRVLARQSRLFAISIPSDQTLATAADMGGLVVILKRRSVIGHVSCRV